MLKKIFMIMIVATLALFAYAATAVVDARPSQIDISAATSESAVLVTASGYTTDDARYRLYNGSNQYNCWDQATGTYISSTSYASGPQVPGTPTTSSTWWILFQRGNNATTVASYRDRLGPTYTTNYMTALLPVATAITAAVSITNSNVTFTTWTDYANKYVVLGYDATVGGTLISATSSALTTGAFDLKVETGTTIRRIEVRDVLNNLIDSVTGTWPTVGTPTILATGTLNAFSTFTGTPSDAQTYNLSGSNLTANISVAAPTGFEISTNGSTYTSSLSLATSFSGLVYVRLIGTTVGPYSGNITHTSTGASQVDIAVTGEVTDPPTPTLFMEENFAYTAATLLTDNGWTAHSTAGTPNPVIVGTTGLSYQNYPPVAGLSGQTVFSGSAEDVHRTFASQTSGNVYASFLFNAQSLPNTTGDYLIHFGPATIGSDFKGRFFIQKDASENLRFGLTKAAAVASAVWTDYIYAQNTTYLIVIKYVINSGATNDQVYMWVNPAIGETEPTPLLTAPDPTGTDAADIGSIAIRQGTYTPIAKIDGIRVTNDWAILWSGEAPPTPIITVTGTPDPLTNYAGTPSEETSSYSLSGTDLQGPIYIVAPEGFEVSSTGTDGWGSSINVPADFNGLIYVQLVSSVIGEHAGNITHNSSGATEVTLRVEGETFASPIVWNITASFTAFELEVGTPSAVQSYTLSASNAIADLVVSVASPFELSQNGTTGWTNELVLPYNFNGLVYVRMNSSIAGQFTENIVHSSLTATPYDLPVSGTATPPAGNYANELFISEYVEGGSYNKAIEIYNGTGAAVNLSSYSVKKGLNGGLAWDVTLVLGDIVLAHNDVYVISRSDAAAGIVAVADSLDANFSNYNGDDAVGLFKNDVLIDVVGLTDGVDPGTGWAVAGTANGTVNHTLIRKPTIVEGNTVWALSAGTNATDSEWIVMAQDYITDLGSHTFSGDLPIAEAPTFDPADGGVYYAPINVSLSSTTPNASIYYTTDGSIPDNTDLLFDPAYPINVSQTTTIKAIAYAAGYAASSVAEALYVFPIDVADIATLRAGTEGIYYRLTSIGVISFLQTYRNQKFIQDATAGILVDDVSGKIQTVYNRYDGIRYLVGTILDFNGMMQFTPYTDPGAAYSTGNTITPQVITLSELFANFESYESELVKVTGITFDTADGILAFANGTVYPMNTAAMEFRTTFYDVDYIGMTVPVGTWDIIGLPNTRYNVNQFTAREWADFSTSGGSLDAPVVQISQAGGTVTLSWDAITGATYYEIWSASDPYSAYTLAEPNWTGTGTITWSETSAVMKFYKVIAKN